MSVYVLLWLRSLVLLCFTSLSTSFASIFVISTPPSVIPAFLSVIPVPLFVIPAQAGIHRNTTNLRLVDSRLRGNDEGGV